MKRFIAMALAATLALSLTACGGAKTDSNAAATGAEKPAAAAKTHLDEIKAAGKIVLGTSADYPPYEFHKTVDGKDTVVGWEVDMAQQIATDLGVKLEVKESAFDNLIADLNAKKVDFVISAMTITDKRKENVDFSDPYWQGGQVVLALKDRAAEFATPDSLKGKTVGVQLGTTGEAEAQKIGGVKLKQVDKFESVILDLLSGKVDAVICGYTVAKNYEKNNPKLATAVQLSSELNGIAFRKGDKELVEAVNGSLKKLSGAKLEEIVKKYDAEASK
jgi:polar amino acid transport system substrate-binding protein